MKNQCLIASYRGDFVWLQHCLRSLKKFSIGFLPPVISVSLQDVETARLIVQKTYPDAQVFIHSVPKPYSEAEPGFGMLRAMSSMMHADILCPEADNIFLVGSDCLATGVFQPPEYLTAAGLPIVLMNSYEFLKTLHPDAVSWRDGTAQILGFTPPCEYMRRLPSVFHRSTFEISRQYISELHGKPFVQYWFDGFAAGQRGQSEANILGAIAHRYQQGRYEFVDMDEASSAFPNSLLQMWSRGGLDKPIDIHYYLDGHDVFGMKPRDAIIAVLGDANDVIPL